MNIALQGSVLPAVVLFAFMRRTLLRTEGQEAGIGVNLGPSSVIFPTSGGNWLLGIEDLPPKISSNRDEDYQTPDPTPLITNYKLRTWTAGDQNPSLPPSL